MRVILPFAVAFSTALSAQTTFAPIGATWTYAAYSVQQFPDPDLFPASITSIGDTVISGTSCRILAVPHLPCYLMGFFTDRIYTFTSNDSVYWYDQAGEAFRLLIPFDAQAGDDWMVPVADPWQSGSMLDTVIYHVDSVSQVSIDGMPLRQLFVTTSTLNPLFGLTTWANGPIVERLGDLYYLMPWLTATCSDGFAVGGLVCYEDPEISWLNPEYTQCDLGVGIDEPIVAPAFIVTPNPVERGAAVRINMSGDPVGNARMEVIDATGRAIATTPIRAQTTAVFLPGPGLFLITVDDGSGHTTTERVIAY